MLHSLWCFWMRAEDSSFQHADLHSQSCLKELHDQLLLLTRRDACIRAISGAKGTLVSKMRGANTYEDMAGWNAGNVGRLLGRPRTTGTQSERSVMKSRSMGRRRWGAMKNRATSTRESGCLCSGPGALGVLLAVNVERVLSADVLDYGRLGVLQRVVAWGGRRRTQKSSIVQEHVRAHVAQLQFPD